jgi:hypothetical protein
MRPEPGGTFTDRRVEHPKYSTPVTTATSGGYGASRYVGGSAFRMTESDGVDIARARVPQNARRLG